MSDKYVGGEKIQGKEEKLGVGNKQGRPPRTQNSRRKPKLIYIYIYQRRIKNKKRRFLKEKKTQIFKGANGV